jgi:glycyl-tRNA synthetase beta chain
LNRSWLGAFAQAIEIYAGQGHALDRDRAENSLSEIFVGRYKALMPEARYDLLEAAVRADDREALSHPRSVRLRLLALEDLSTDSAFVQTATRPLNIVAAAEKKGVVVPEQLDLASLDSTEGTTLATALSQSEAPLRAALQAEDPAGIANALRQLSGPINAFFDSTMVMVDDARVRDARLALLKQAGRQLLNAGDWTLVVVE